MTHNNQQNFAHKSSEVRALPPEQQHHLGARPAHHDDGKAIVKIQNPPHSDQDTLKVTRGKELREAAKVWVEVAESESRINLMRKMKCLCKLRQPDFSPVFVYTST